MYVVVEASDGKRTGSWSRVREESRRRMVSGPTEREENGEGCRDHWLWPQKGHRNCGACNFGFLAEGRSQVAVG